jgi:hypothetical protein
VRAPYTEFNHRGSPLQTGGKRRLRGAPVLATWSIIPGASAENRKRHQWRA